MSKPFRMKKPISTFEIAFQRIVFSVFTHRKVTNSLEDTIPTYLQI